MRVGGQTLTRVATLINSHPRLIGPYDTFKGVQHVRSNIGRKKVERSCTMFDEISALLNYVNNFMVIFVQGCFQRRLKVGLTSNDSNNFRHH